VQRNLIRGSQGVVPGNRAASPEIANFKETEAARGDSVLAAAILRLQPAQRVESRGRTAIHAPQPGQARSCGEAGRLAMVQLSALRNGEDERGGDRVGVDRPTTGREQGFGKGASVNPTLRKVLEGWGTRPCSSATDAPARPPSGGARPARSIAATNEKRGGAGTADTLTPSGSYAASAMAVH